MSTCVNISKMPSSRSGAMPTPVSRTRNDDLRNEFGRRRLGVVGREDLLSFHREPDATATISKLARIVQEVAHDLRESSRVRARNTGSDGKVTVSS